MKFAQDLTVLVTNFGRAERLRKCLESIIKAGVTNVVVSSTCPDEAVAGVLTEYATKFPLFLNVTTEDDFGCNEAWLRGAYHVRTKYILILHDDDQLEPEFGEVYRELIWPNLESGVGLASWQGRAVTDAGLEFLPKYYTGQTAILSTGILTKCLLTPGASQFLLR
jgi:glycosyltransferase involved in cell wall biosynthesis